MQECCPQHCLVDAHTAAECQPEMRTHFSEQSPCPCCLSVIPQCINSPRANKPHLELVCMTNKSESETLLISSANTQGICQEYKKHKGKLWRETKESLTCFIGTKMKERHQHNRLVLWRTGVTTAPVRVPGSWLLPGPAVYVQPFGE